MVASRSLLSAVLTLSYGLTAVKGEQAWNTRKWDAIVIGGGTAGIIAADKYSAAGINTLLLELGGPSYGITGGKERPEWLNHTDLSRVDVPGLYKSIFSGSSSLKCKPEVVNAFQGCTVGGNSAINAGLYFQPPASDWDDYHPAGWKSKDVQAATARLLKRQPTVTEYSSDHKFYLQTGYDAVKKWIVQSAGFREAQIDKTSADMQRVFGRPVYNYINGQRGGPTRTYLQSAKARRNFNLQLHAQVEYIVQDKGTASGVVVTVDGKRFTVNLARGGFVTVSSGALLSPKVLMYSGIGPKAALSQLAAGRRTPYQASTSWIVNEGVGVGLFDNPNTFIEFSAPTIQSYVHNYSNPIQKDADSFLQHRAGPYTFASQTSVFWGYIKHPDGSRTGVQGTTDSSGYSDFSNSKTITLNIYGTSGMKSSGRVELSRDGKFIATPSSDVYYSNPQDAQSIAQFIHDIFQKLPASTPKKPATNGLTPLNIPRDSTLEQIRKYITTPSAYAVGSTQHWTSSCRIGKAVDPSARVLGTKNIYVVDASIVAPLTVNPQFGVMVAAEHATDKILASRGHGARAELSIEISI